MDGPAYAAHVAMDAPQAGTEGVSEDLRSFVEDMPYERRSILQFVSQIADSLPFGARVLDVGAGDAPYRELFDHCEYRTSDWGNSLHALDVDMIASADALPVEDACLDAVLLTQVLEHVPDPAAVLGEAARVLRPGGTVAVTVPFVWELHELPFDFWRYTPASLSQLLEGAGFVDVAVAPRSDCFTTVAQLLHNLRWAMGDADDGRSGERAAAAEVLDELAERVAALAPLDARGVLPLGWTARAVRGEA
jgi:SAM-dependent methyltransferase